MWFEILPAAGIIFTVFNIPWIFMYGVHTLAFGNAYRRQLQWEFDRALYLRDRRLTDSPYLRNGLETIPDAEDDEDDDLFECFCDEDYPEGRHREEHKESCE